MIDVVEVLVPTGPQVVEIAVPGETGPAGPDPWAEPIQEIAAAGATVIDYAAGKHVRLSVTAGAAISVTNWPAGRIARLTLEIDSNGSALALPAGVLWPGGSAPVIGAGRHILVLMTTDAGATLYGMPAGLNFA
jgi:hypothetical protein